jgi:hypothetical protein
MSKVELALEAQVQRAQDALRKTGLTYQAMSDTYGIKIGQIQKFMSGRLKKIPPEIEEVLVRKLGVNVTWLIDGPEPLIRFDAAVAKLKRASDAAVEVALHFTPVSAMLRRQMQELAFNENLDKDRLMERFRDRLPQTAITEEEKVLLSNYRAVADGDKRAIERMVALAAQAAMAGIPKE